MIKLKEEKYFQLPLYILQLVHDELDKEKLKLLLAYGLLNFGKRHYAKYGDESFKKIYETKVDSYNEPEDYNYLNTNHQLYTYATTELEIRLQRITPYETVATQLQNAIQNYTDKHGADAEFRIKTDFVNAMASGSLSFREFAVLSAIYSILGDKAYYPMTYKQIQYRAHGFRSEKIWEELSNYEFKWSISQIRRTVYKLHERRFFAKVTRQNRNNFYSIRLQHSQIRVALEQRANKRSMHKEKERDQAMNARIRAIESG